MAAAGGEGKEEEEVVALGEGEAGGALRRMRGLGEDSRRRCCATYAGVGRSMRRPGRRRGRGEERARPRDPAAWPMRPAPPVQGPAPSGSARSRRRGGRRAADGDGGRECRAAGGDAGVRPTEGT